ncbi:hypothetical protein [Microlunatus parietis]|uniref:Uncharacterized protein n=1 Tax=Microlunatus parietis TaxID=682979 RepID=A0A7Y9IB08_9ACTN|nr:hypothetical protein [Microlunatus parietis]NYE73524.1 hypothetical protein [Microlunatus parietis]
MTDSVIDRRRRGRAAWLLLLLAPLCAELAFSAVSMPIMWLAFPFLIPMYGLGVLVIRELVIRSGGGWPSLLLMGLVYELAEDGLGLQALTSPVLYNAAEWGPRVLGLNLTYWESQVGYHLTFSVLIPVMITNLVFPELRAEPYLRRRGLIISGIAAALGIAMLKIVFTSTTDPGYLAPLPFLVGLVAVMGVLSFVALRILPRRWPAAAPPVADRGGTGPPVPPPPVAALIAAAATLIFLGLLMPGDPMQGPAIGEGSFVLLPMTVAAAVAITVAVLIVRWHNAGMSDRHRIWLAGGALVAHTLFPIVTTILHPVDQLTTTVALTAGPAMIVVTVLLLARLAAVTGRRSGQLSPADRSQPLRF